MNDITSDVIVNDILCFVANKRLLVTQEQLKSIVLTHFNHDEIVKSSLVISQRAQTSQPEPGNDNVEFAFHCIMEAFNRLDLSDSLKPVFAAKNLNRMPTEVTRDNALCSIYAEIQLLKSQVDQIQKSSHIYKCCACSNDDPNLVNSVTANFEKQQPNTMFSSQEKSSVKIESVAQPGKLDHLVARLQKNKLGRALSNVENKSSQRQASGESNNCDVVSSSTIPSRQMLPFTPAVNFNTHPLLAAAFQGQLNRNLHFPQQDQASRGLTRDLFKNFSFQRASTPLSVPLDLSRTGTYWDDYGSTSERAVSVDQHMLYHRIEHHDLKSGDESSEYMNMSPKLEDSLGSPISTASMSSSNISPESVSLAAKTFVCTKPNCSKRFANKFLLKKHEFIHTGERPYQCLYCVKRFNRKDNLGRHMKTHVEQRHSPSAISRSRRKSFAAVHSARMTPSFSAPTLHQTAMAKSLPVFPNPNFTPPHLQYALNARFAQMSNALMCAAVAHNQMNSMQQSGRITTEHGQQLTDQMEK